MSVRAIAATCGACAALFLWPTYSAGGAAAREEEPPAPARQRELISLVRQDCGSCHGMSLTGGLGPALDRDTLQTRPMSMLRAAILDGRPGTAMPPWRGLLSEPDVDWIAARLLEGFPDER